MLASKISEKEIAIFEKCGYAKTYGELTQAGLRKIMHGVTKKEKTFADLGSGSGAVVIHMIELYPQLHGAIGIELSKTRYNIAVKNIREKHRDKINFINDDLFVLPLHNVDIIYVSNLCFSPIINKRLAKKIEQECRKNTVIVASAEFSFSRKHRVKKITGVEQSWSANSTVHKYHLL